MHQTANGGRPIYKFLSNLPDVDRADILQAMKEVAEEGLPAARHLREDIYEVRAESTNCIYRVLFASEGRYGHIFLSLEVFNKKTQKTPPDKIDLAQKRLHDWRARSK